MPKEENQGITVKKDQDFSEWYQQVILRAELAEYSPVKGCMIIKPAGYSIWEAIQNYFNERLQKLGVKNAYFPLFIPESFFKKEAEHAKGFQPEVAWIANKDEGSERLAVRPTSETIMYDAYSRWVRSYRDLPLRINQWSNVVRFETKATRLFLRTREFLWQEGHCVYETEKECNKETRMFLDEYAQLCKELLAIPVIQGKKTEEDKFAGALYTTTIESFMPDGKSLQCGTSHNLGQNFARSFGISFLGRDEKSYTPWQNSWGISTRLIGAMVMLHSDDNGLVLPPRVAYNKAVIIPIIFEKEKDKILKEAELIEKELKTFNAILDNREGYSPGWKFNDWELKGIPLRIEVGPKDLQNKQVVVVRRDTGKKEVVKRKQLKEYVRATLEKMQDELYAKAKRFLNSSVVEVRNEKELTQALKNKKIASALCCCKGACEDKIKEMFAGVKIICIPFDQKRSEGQCIMCQQKSKEQVYIAKSY